VNTYNQGGGVVDVVERIRALLGQLSGRTSLARCRGAEDAIRRLRLAYVDASRQACNGLNILLMSEEPLDSRRPRAISMRVQAHLQGRRSFAGDRRKPTLSPLAPLARALMDDT